MISCLFEASLNHIWSLKIKRFCFTLLCSLAFSAVFLSNKVHAESRTCYQPYEVEAEQGIRIHSELLVIGLNCPHQMTSRGQSLIKAYKQFTDKNIKLFSTYEKIMLNFFAKAGVYSAEAELNSFRTHLANRVALDAAKLKPNVFCKKYGGRIEAASRLTRQELREWAATLYPGHPVTQPLCASHSSKNLR